ncbi:hypothetical protein TBLA_0D00690 [Henningerozyma blattae CBS 6284]|uniref:30 kDa heat shock protein n=1 Tax=Henningerozyma blattae (strain ATCC 34711 / CBS 6284 / DSM 70876 / NBRC 10599 / NRRL Y-10934 / UCD 77-7) TaxID=1071380 RepID=I2H2H5_HENB6|nr:hypothetical protein TBLA_0D00690 [Tetrapisispora blattae CBS 6284]CCH60577.1 hypothetical protein TBLA_0D00690 [Tetrapisispora blattae CBS 6284]
MSQEFIELVRRGNRAVHVNPPKDLDVHLTEHGSDWLWSVYSVFGVLAVMYATFFFYQQLKGGRQLIRYTLAGPFLISIFQFFQYFTYASNLGWTNIQAEFRGEDVSRPVTNMYPNVRQIFYAKYVAWFLCWPIQIFLLELAGITIDHQGEVLSCWALIHSILVQIIGYEYWIIALLVGSLIHSTYKWGYWVMGVFVLLCTLGIQCKRQVFELKIRGFSLAMYLTAIIVTLLYNVSWGLSDGGNAISPNGEAVFYGVLDECVFAIWTGYLCFVTCRYGEWPEVETGMLSDPRHMPGAPEKHLPDSASTSGSETAGSGSGSTPASRGSRRSAPTSEASSHVTAESPRESGDTEFGNHSPEGRPAGSSVGAASPAESPVAA